MRTVITILLILTTAALKAQTTGLVAKPHLAKKTAILDTRPVIHAFGIIMDYYKTPLPFAVITLNGKNIFLADSTGYFSISLHNGDTLSASVPGFLTGSYYIGAGDPGFAVYLASTYPKVYQLNCDMILGREENPCNKYDFPGPTDAISYNAPPQLPFTTLQRTKAIATLPGGQN